MKKLTISKKILALALCFIMVLGIMPIMPMTANAATTAKLPAYISEIAVAYGDTESEAKSRLAGYTIINVDLNDGCGSGTPYIYMGYKTSTDVNEAIRLIWFCNEYFAESATYAKVGGQYEHNGSGQGAVDLNKGCGKNSDYIYTCINRAYGASPIIDIVINSSESYAGYETAAYNTTYTKANLNSGTKGDDIYLHFKRISDLETVTLHYLDANGERTTAVPKTPWFNSDVLEYSVKLDNSTIPSPVTYNGTTYYFNSWRAPNGLFYTTPLGHYHILRDWYARYDAEVTLTFDKNGGSGAPSPITGTTHFVMSDPVDEAKASVTIPNETFSHDTKGAFLGWSEDKNATTISYLPGSSIEINKNTTLYAIYAEHNLTYSLIGDNTIKEECTVGNCNHSETATLAQDANVPTVYNGSAIEALKVTYSDNWSGGNLVIDYSNNTDVGTASGSISIDGVTATETFAIEKSDINANDGEVFLISGWVGAYDGEPHQLQINKQPPGAVVFYRYGDGDWTSTNPAFKDAGLYEVHYKVVSPNYNDYEGTQSVRITPIPLTVSADDASKTFGENDPTFTWKITSGALLSGEQLTGINTSRKNGENADTYAITASQAEGANKNYDITFVDGTFTIKAKTVTATVTVTGAPFYYNTTAQKPDIVAKDGDTVIPASEYDVIYADNTNVGTATVTVTDNDGGNYVVNGATTFIINKADPVIGAVGADGVVTDNTKPSDVVLTRTDTTVDGVLNLADGAMLANKATYRWVFTPADTDNYNVINGDVQIDVLDTVMPTATITIDTNEWKQFVNNITFGLFFKDTQQVTIAAADNENGSGIKDILYFVSNKRLADNDLAAVEWNSYAEAFDIDPDGKFIVYVKVTDNDGNAVIISSDGVVVDETAAVVSGITDGEAYYGDITFTAADALAGVKDVSIDGTPAAATDGTYTIAGDNAEHTVTVTDNAENVTEYKITVYKNYTVTYTADGQPVSTETVGHGKDAKLPDVPQKDGYVGKWNSDGKNITGDTTIKAVYTEIPKTDTPGSPQTGDNSNLWMWFALLISSGAGAFGIALNDRKKSGKQTINKS